MRRRPRIGLPVLAAIAAVAVAVALRPGAGTPSYSEASTWRGLVGEAHPQVALGERRIVLLRTPSVADRLAKARYATEQQERQWVSQAYAAQQQVLVGLASHGLGVRPDFTYARVVDGFSAVLDPRAEALLERDPEVLGVYQVRAAFPAAIRATAPAPDVAVDPVTLPGYDGRGVQIALIDTGVDRTHPYLGGRVLPGVDVVDGGDAADAHTAPQDATRVERHGTELAGLLVGRGGPHGIRGGAPAATVFPVRVAGWQPDATGRDVVYARSDQLIAGLERAVDPNGDGDTHDAARIALVGVTEPYAAFADSPEARAVDGALALDTLVVVPAGNEGGAGPAFGSLDGPGGATGAVTVAAADARTSTGTVRLVVWHGLESLFDARLPLLGSVTPGKPLDLAVGRPRGTGERVEDYFDRRGLGLVSGKAALVRAGGDPGAAVSAAAHAGAAAVLIEGGNLPAGSLGFSTDVAVPVVAVPAPAARAILAALRAGGTPGVGLGRSEGRANPLEDRTASFSSRGLAFSGALKPDLAAPGVGLPTADPGAASDGEPAFATVNGTSAAAAAVAGAAAVLAQARPELRARELASVLAGSARFAGAPLPAGGAGILDLGASAAAVIAASATSLTLDGRSWRTLTVRNVSPGPLVVQAVLDPELRVVPQRLVLRAGRAARLRVRAQAPQGNAGVLELTPVGGAPLRIPWIVFPRRPAAALLRRATLADSSFAPSDTSPAVLTVDVGRVTRGAAAQIEPAARLDVLLYTAGGTFVGLLTRVRDLLPGAYRFGITGRAPGGTQLAPGGYELRLVAWPTHGGAPSRLHVRFAIQSG